MSKFTGEYPKEWKAIAKEVKDKACWRCIRCGHPHDPSTGHTLTVHHLDNDKSNIRWHNLTPLCQKCHLTIQGKVRMHRAWILPHTPWMRPFAAGYYAYQRGLPDDEQYVLAHLDELLMIGQGL
jgi:5-methylcytosine-specific restriction endonuclease McrA